MKRANLFLTIIVLFTLFVLFSCQKEELEQSISDNKIEVEEGLLTINYIYNDISYSEVLKENDDLIEVITPVDNIITEVLNNPNSCLVKDPFNNNTYYVFSSSIESKNICNKIENKIKNEIANHCIEKSGTNGWIELYKDRYFRNQIYGTNNYYVPWLTSNEGFPNMGSYNDVISSYRVYGSTTDNIDYKVVFYEHTNYGGHTLTAYAYSNYNGTIKLWSDCNLHGTLMQGGIFNRKYWGDQISSIYWRRF